MKNNKNNKGFSLVELIVVVLIMAIIAVALAPQVMKWVANSRIANDKQTVDEVVSAAQLAYTDKTLTSDATVYTINVTSSGAAVTAPSGSSDNLTSIMNGIVTLSDCKMKSGKSVEIKVQSGKIISNNASSILANSDLD